MAVREIILCKLAEGPVFARNWAELASKLGFDDPTRQSLRVNAAAVLDGLISLGFVKRERGVPDDPMHDPRMGPCREVTQAYSLTEKGEEAFRRERATPQAAPVL